GAAREYRRPDEAGRLLERRVLRRNQATRAHGGEGQVEWSSREGYEYDGQGRWIWHWLPEGGALQYRWHSDVPRSDARRSDARPDEARLAGVALIDAWGRRHELITATDKPAVDSATPSAAFDGYRYGNGIRLRGVLRDG